MNTTKEPMSGIYKVVFALSIFMMFATLIGGSLSGSKSVGFGIWFWGYTAWLMFKRNNKSLAFLQKAILWLQGILFSIGFIILLFSDVYVRKYVDVSPFVFLIIGVISMTVSFVLYKFFDNQLNRTSAELFSVNSSSGVIDDKYWEQASLELEGRRNEATWAKSFAFSDGDESKAKALYIKTRANVLKTSERSASSPAEVVKQRQSPSFLMSEVTLFLGSFNGIGKISILAIVALVGYSLYENLSKHNSELSKISTSEKVSSTQTSPSISNESSKICIFIWNDNLSKFERLASEIIDISNYDYTSTILFKYEKESYYQDLFAQLRKADAANNSVLARSIAKTIRENTLTVYYSKSFSKEFIILLATEHDLRSKCV